MDLEICFLQWRCFRCRK